MAISHRAIWSDISFSCAACLLQFPVIYEIGRYTALTGESIFQGFIRLNRKLGLLLWILMTLSFLWFGAFAAAGIRLNAAAQEDKAAPAVSLNLDQRSCYAGANLIGRNKPWPKF